MTESLSISGLFATACTTRRIQNLESMGVAS